MSKTFPATLAPDASGQEVLLGLPRHIHHRQSCKQLM
jgi:hypothetical protein